METITAETSRGQEVPAQPQEEPSISEKKQMRVLVEVDEADDSFNALKWILDKLFTYSPAGATPEPDQEHLVLVHVVHSFPQYVFPVVFPTASVAGSVNKVLRETAAILLSRALKICKEKKVGAKTLILDGDPKEKICQATEEMHADLLVVGSRRLGKIKRALLGSVSDYCAHHANCPVLIVKPAKEFGK